MQAVLFDMDGVLVDSEDYWVTREREALLPRAVPDHDVAVSEITGMNYREIYDYLEDEYGTAVSRERFETLFEDVAEDIYREDVTLLAGTHDLLAGLERRGVARAIVSSSPHAWIDIVRERFGLHGSFDAVVSAEDVDGPGKPAPDVFEYAAAELGVPPAACLVIEDSAHGIQAATAAGATCVAYAIDAHEGIDYGAADAVVETPAALSRAVRERI